LHVTKLTAEKQHEKFKAGIGRLFVTSATGSTILRSKRKGQCYQASWIWDSLTKFSI